MHLLWIDRARKKGILIYIFEEVFLIFWEHFLQPVEVNFFIAWVVCRGQHAERIQQLFFIIFCLLFVLHKHPDQVFCWNLFDLFLVLFGIVVQIFFILLLLFREHELLQRFDLFLDVWDVGRSFEGERKRISNPHLKKKTYLRLAELSIEEK